MGCLKLLLMRKGFCAALIQVIPPNFEKRNYYFPKHISQSPIVTSSEEAIRLARKLEGTGKRHSTADTE